jgi:ribonuclease P protein component
MAYRFGPGVRLRSRPEFTTVQQGGSRVVMRYLTMLGRRNALGRDRLGVIASRRVGNAVARNRAKRRLREIFRGQQPDVPRADGRTLDLVVIPRAGFLDAPFAVLKTDFATGLKRLRAQAAS